MNYKTNKECLNCSRITFNGNCLHHIKTRGSGGTDDEWNLMPLCQQCHNKVHAEGLTKFSRNLYVEKWLKENGWEFNVFLERWVHGK